MQLLHAALLTPTGRSTHGSGFLFFREETGSRDLLTGQGDQMRFLGRNVPRLWAPGAAISKCRDLILLAMTTVPGDAGLRTRSFGRMTEGAHRVCLDTSSQGVGSGPLHCPPPLTPTGLPSRPADTASSEHAPVWWDALQRAPLQTPRPSALCSDLGDLPAVLPSWSGGLFATTFCKILECLQAPELSLGRHRVGSQASP